MAVTVPLPENNKLSGAGLPWPLHPACAIWPDLSPADLRDLADDIAANGLRDPITLTPASELLDGKNRASACIMAGVDPAARPLFITATRGCFPSAAISIAGISAPISSHWSLAALAKRSEGAPAGNRNAAKNWSRWPSCFRRRAPDDCTARRGRGHLQDAG